MAKDKDHEVLEDSKENEAFKVPAIAFCQMQKTAALPKQRIEENQTSATTAASMFIDGIAVRSGRIHQSEVPSCGLVFHILEQSKS